jgi:hypothetical protein
MHIDSLEQWKHEHDFNIDTSQGERRTRLVVVLTACMMVVEITAGYLYGSMALLADGWHMGTHVAALAISLFAYRYARQHADNPVYSFGTGKVSALGGYASAVALAVVAVLMGMESVHRLLFPETIHFDQAILVASIGLVVNLLSAWLLHGGAAHSHHHNDAAHDHHHHHDHNLRAAYLHVIGDTMRCARRGRTRRGLVVGPNGFCNAMSLCLKKGMSAIPAMNPPMWAPKATPPSPEAVSAEDSSCIANQRPSTQTALSWIVWMIKPRGIRTRTLA